MNRRQFLRASGTTVLASSLLLQADHANAAQAEATGHPLDPWQPGYLEIHHINTGRGNSALSILPDGTTLLTDAGAVSTRGPQMCPARPDDSKRPGEWIARYIQRRFQAASLGSGLDYALLTHFHGDHIGDPTSESPKSRHGDYRLSGISDVAETISIGTLIDRGYPAYDNPAPATGLVELNYIAFARSAASRGTRVEQVRPGSATQITLRHQAARYPEFGVRMIAGNATVWTGQDEESKALFPPGAAGGVNATSNENSLSIALRMQYGAFRYFNGGDLNCDTNYGRDPWHDVESAAARAAGPVNVSTCDHHGYFDACGPDFVRALQARIWILQSWHASHPALSTLANLYSTDLYPGPRDVFSTGLHPAAALADDRFASRFKSSQGHVVLRVQPGGHTYSILVIEDGEETDRVKAVFGPFNA